MFLMILLLFAGVGALYFGADWMVRGAARLQENLGLSPVVIGLTVVSLGTSVPEFIVVLLAILKGSSDLGVGNVLGSNLANIGLILGAAALVRPLLVADRVVRREIPIMIGVTLLIWPLAADGGIDRLDGAFLTLVLGVYLAYVFHRGTKAPAPLVSGYTKLAAKGKAKEQSGVPAAVGFLLAGTLGLLLGGRAIVESAIFLSRSLGISELVIGLTVVAVGTSLPELATSVMAALKRQTDIAVGNVIGSNIFNLAGVLGITGMVKPVDVDPGVLWVELPAVLAISLLVFLASISPMTEGEFNIRRWEGALLLGTYILLGFWIL